MRTEEALGLAVRHHRAGRIQEAEKLYRNILETEPYCVDAWHLLGVASQQSGRPDLAVEYIGRAVELSPGFAEAHSNLGSAFHDMGMFEQAADCHLRALVLRPDYAGGHANLANVYKDSGRLAEAVGCYRRSIELEPNAAEVHQGLGVALKGLGLLEEAVECYRRAVALKPDYAEAHNNLGNALKEQGRLEDAMACYGRAVALRPDYAGARFNRSVALLLQGEFDGGWQEFEWRHLRQGDPSRQPIARLWDGRSCNGGAVLLQAEKGLGDTIQFVRYAALVKQRGAKVLLECQAPLLPLLASCPGIDRLIAEGSQRPNCDSYAPLMSLPGIVRTTLADVPAVVPYLFAAPYLIEKWRGRLKPIGGLRIAIAWQGNPAYAADRERSIDMRHFEPLARQAGVTLISLQKGAGREQLNRAPGLPPIVDLADEIDSAEGAFMDSAAVMKNVDLVITSDTALAHLAGALGVPVWVALSHMPDWRWLLNRTDSPWYPTMRLFRQKTPGDWAGVFAEMSRELEDRRTPHDGAKSAG